MAGSPQVDLRKLDKTPSVASAMTPFPYSVDVDDAIDTARDLMARHDISHVPVKDRHHLVGVLGQRDVANAVPAVTGPTRVRDLPVGEAYVVELNTPLALVAAEMARRHIDSALVVKKGRLAGIFTVTDACRVLGAILRSRFDDPGGEAA
jgi:acetoin utilization protein AcuB